MGKGHQMVDNNNIASAIVDSGATSSCGLKDDPFHHTNEPSRKIFAQPDGKKLPAANKAKLKHDLVG